MFTNQTNHKSAVGTNTIGQAVTFLFPISEISDIVVKSVVTLTGVETLLTITTNYTVVIAADDGGGTVTMVTAVPVTSTIHITRATPMTQELDLVAGGSFNAENIEDALDKVTKMAVDNKKALSFCLRLPGTDSESSELTTFAGRAEKFLYFGDDGAPTVAESVATGETTISAFAETVIDDANATAMLGTLGLTVSAYGKTLIGSAAATNARDTLGLKDYSATLKAADVITKSPAVDVRAFGAVGDGVTDDTSDIQDAIDAAVAANLPVYFPGTSDSYYIETNITITSDTMLFSDSNIGATLLGKVGVSMIYVSNDADLVMRNLRIEDVGSIAVRISGNVGLIDIQDCYFDNCGHALHTALSTHTVDRFVFVGNTIVDGDYGIRLEVNTIGETLVTHNKIYNLSNTLHCAGIHLGNDNQQDPSTRTRHIVTNNHVEKITTTDATEVYRTWGIKVFGDYVTVCNNIVSDIDSTNANKDNQGIYAKMRYGAVSNNVLYNAAKMKEVNNAQGAITIKGEERGGAGTSTWAWGIVCNGNVILSDDARISCGIWVGCEQMVVSNNYIEGTWAAGIYTSPDYDLNDISITGNVLKNLRSNMGIEIEHSGDGLIISNNMIRNLLDTSAGANSDGIRFHTQFGGGDLTDVQVQNNQISITNTASTTNAYGINFTQTGTFKHVVITGNLLNIADAGTTNYGIAFLGTDNTAENVIIENNDMTYTDTPISFSASVPNPLTIKNNTPITVKTLANNATPTVLGGGDIYITGGTTGITDFDDGVIGQVITVLCKHTLTFDFTTAQDADHNLDGSLADITALTGDVLRFLCEDGTRWVLISNNSAAADNN